MRSKCALNNVLDPTKNKSFTYDALDRLSTATAPGIWGSLGWTYDGVGNRETENSTAYTYVPGTSKLNTVGGVSYSFDNNGNTTAEGARAYTYNQNQRLIRVVDAGVTKGEYIYNGNGQRVKKVVNGTATVFHYDQDGLIIAESDNAGTSTAEYVYLKGTPLAKIEGSSVYFYHDDRLSTPQKMTDSSGTVVWSADYKPFGEATITVSTIMNNLRFPGQYFDAETGMNYNIKRDYNTVLGRYAQADPIGLGGGINLYVYALNSPLMYIDPTGEDAGSGVTAEWVLGKIMEVLIGGRPSITPNINVLWGEKCCCNGQTYRKKVTTVALRVRIGTLGNIDGGGKFSSCGPCEEDMCFSLTAGFNVSQFAVSRIPAIGASLGRYLNDFGSIRVNATGQYCMNRGFTYLNVGASARFLYVGAGSTNIRVF